MNKTILIVVFLFLGCEPPPPRVEAPPPPPTPLEIISQKDPTEMVFEDKQNDHSFGAWEVVKVKHKNTVYTYIHNVCYSSQSLTLVRIDEVTSEER